jgi:hypothetical protein
LWPSACYATGLSHFLHQHVNQSKNVEFLADSE